MKNRIIFAAGRLSLLIPTAQVRTNCNSLLHPTLIQTYRSTCLSGRKIPAACKHLPFIALFFAVFTLSSCKNENTEGKKLYDNHCLQCHQEGGKGVGKLIPPIDKTYLANNSSKLGCILKYGMNESITINGTIYNGEMPKNDRLSDFDIVNLLNYINQEFGSGSSKKFNIEHLKNDLNNCQGADLR